MSSLEELRRIAEAAQAEIADRERLQRLGQLARERAAAEKTAEERAKRLSDFRAEVSRKLAEGTSESALRQAARMGERSVFVPAGQWRKPSGEYDYGRQIFVPFPEGHYGYDYYSAIVKQESEAWAATLRLQGHYADVQTRSDREVRFPGGSTVYNSPFDDRGYATPPRDVWMGVEVRW